MRVGEIAFRGGYGDAAQRSVPTEDVVDGTLVLDLLEDGNEPPAEGAP